MICMTDSKCVIFLSIMYLFFFLQERDTLSKNILNSEIKIILKTKLIRNFASFFLLDLEKLMKLEDPNIQNSYLLNCKT